MNLFNMGIYSDYSSKQLKCFHHMVALTHDFEICWLIRIEFFYLFQVKYFYNFALIFIVIVSITWNLSRLNLCINFLKHVIQLHLLNFRMIRKFYCRPRSGFP